MQNEDGKFTLPVLLGEECPLLPGRDKEKCVAFTCRRSACVSECVKSKECERVAAVEVLNLALYFPVLSIRCVSSEAEIGKKKRRFCLYTPFSPHSFLINPPGLSLAAAEEALSSAHQICECRVTHSIQNCICFLHLQVLSLGEKRKESGLCACWSRSKCRREQGPDLLILFSHRGSEAQSAVPSKLIHSGWAC